ncbi:Hypothetical protein A7982_02362 [Minicystis rosea]|nr:Hypothetical protein A7982_02362 [Minicystis rosea]
MAFCQTFDLASLCAESSGACILPSDVVLRANTAPSTDAPNGEFLDVVPGNTVEISVSALRPQLPAAGRLHVTPAVNGMSAIHVFIDDQQASCWPEGPSGFVCDLPAGVATIDIRTDDPDGGWGEPPAAFPVTAYIEEGICTGVWELCAL